MIYILSIVGVVLTPPVLVASIYGMNFKYARAGLDVGLCLGAGADAGLRRRPFLLFKARGWL